MTTKATPIQQRYNALQLANPGALILIQLGDFFEAFGDNAEVIAREINISLTVRRSADEPPLPMCGFPYWHEGYIQQLEAKGYRVVVESRKHGLKREDFLRG